MLFHGLKVTAGVCVALGCSYLCYKVADEYVQDQVCKWLSEASEENRAEALVLKSEFQRAEVRQANVVGNHTHGESAAERSTASLLMRRVAEGCGREAYYYQGSGADARAGRAYSRMHFWAKDLMAPYSDFDPGDRDVISMVDVDYYVDDLEDMLVKRFQPYLFYTLVPSSAAKDCGEYDYRFLQDGKVEYGVRGGGRYVHKIWNWDGDSLRIVLRCMGIDYAMACYAVERRQMGPDHQLILLVPLVRTYNPFWVWLAKNRVQARALERFNPVVGNFVRFYVSSAGETGGLDVVTGIVGEYASSRVPAGVDSIIASTARTISGKLTRQTVLSKMDSAYGGRAGDTSGSEILLEFHLSHAPTKERISLVDAVRRYQYLARPADVDEDAKAGMTAFMQPLLDGGFVPDVCKNNEQRMVDKRVKEPTCVDKPVTKFVLDCMDEFIMRLVPKERQHTLHPVDVEEVYARQSKPSQRAILAEAEHTRSTGVTSQFVKREAYGSINDPRGISTICGPDKRDYARFMYAFTDEVMKPQKWYAFGKTPLEVANRVAEVAQMATVNGANKDFSRMDGRHGEALHVFERKVYTAAFKQCYHAQLLELMDKHHHLKAKTAFGIRYTTAFHRLSGGADTSCGNTLDTAFIAFLTYRMQGFHANLAWGSLGIYGGDDGFDVDVEPRTAARAASLVGQKLDLETIELGEPGVAFLARRYGPDVWYGDNNSCCDIKRQLAKFHLTVNLPSKVTKQQKLQEKSFSFALTDKNTPILGEFVNKALELFPLRSSEYENVLGTWGVEMDAGNQYPNSSAEWMDDIVSSELPDFDVARFREWLATCDGGTIFNPPRFADSVPPNPKPGVVAFDCDILVVGDNGGTSSSAPRDTDKSDVKAYFRPRKPKTERDSRKLKPDPNLKSKGPGASIDATRSRTCLNAESPVS
jgi:hypothetical protein